MPPLGQPPVPLPSIGQPPMNIPPPPPPPPVGVSACQPPVVHPMMGQPPILPHHSLNKPSIGQMAISQIGIPQPSVGISAVAPITSSTIPLTVRGDLMPSEDSAEMEMDHQESSIQEAESEPPAPGTEELSIDHAPNPSKFLF